MDENISDDRFGYRTKRADPKPHVVHNFNADAVGNFSERPNDVHPFGKSFQVMKTHLEFVAVDELLGRPGDWNWAAARCHDDEVPLRAAL
jgi:hypothetical protein